MSPWYVREATFTGLELTMFVIQRNYGPGSVDRVKLQAALDKMQGEMPFDVPCVIDGKEVRSPGSSSVTRTHLGVADPNR